MSCYDFINVALYFTIMQEFSEEKSILFYEKSKFQDILVFRSAQHGNVLVLDGVVRK